MSVRRAADVEALAPGIVAYELWGDGDPNWLDTAELALVDGAVPARVAQFAAGRRCARLALAEFDVEPAPIVRSVGRAPAWPDGLYGSISHTDGYAVAVVGRPDPEVSSVGVDAEWVGRVDERLYSRLFVDAERQWLASLSEADAGEASTELFGLKESFYKAQFPLTGAWVGFHDVVVGRTGHCWRLQPATDLAELGAVAWPCTGRSLIRDDVAVTVVTVRASSLSE